MKHEQEHVAAKPQSEGEEEDDEFQEVKNKPRKVVNKQPYVKGPQPKPTTAPVGAQQQAPAKVKAEEPVV